MGNRRIKNSRMDGKQVQMMPTLISTVDQMDTSTWSNVGLAELPRLTRNWSRTMLTTVTLGFVSDKRDCVKIVVVERMTYKVPTRSMIATPIFFFQ